LLKCKDERARKWELALKVAFPGKVSPPNVNKVPINSIKKSEKFESNPEEFVKSTIVLDTSDMAPVPFDEEIMAELAAMDAKVDGKNE
jgi:hypothetical protein